MRAVPDTNVFVSALMVLESKPARLVRLWRDGKFTLLTSESQLDELKRVIGYPKVHDRVSGALAGRLINEIRDLGVMVGKMSTVKASPDPYDDCLLEIALAGSADYLITGDKSDLLILKKYQGIAIISISQFFVDLTDKCDKPSDRPRRLLMVTAKCTQAL